MLTIFNYSFMIRAFLAGGILGLIAPLIGIFLVTRRYSLMADSLSHIALSGIAIGLITGIYPIYMALCITILSAIVIEYLRTSKSLSGETALAMFLYAGLATAIILISATHGFNADLFSYLFGSITTVTSTDIWIMSGLGTGISVAIYLLYPQLLAISFNEEAAQVSGIKVKTINTILVILTAITVSLSMRIVGLLLIGALMVIPATAAMLIAHSFRQTLVYSLVIGFVSVIVGLFVSYYANIAAGGSIVAFALILFGLTSLKK